MNALSDSPASRAHQSGTRSLRFRILLALGSFVFGLVVCDAALWLLAPVEHPYPDPFINRHLNLPAPGQWTFETDGKILPGVSGPTTFTVNRFGFRGSDLQSVEKPPGTRRVFCIGGSTTECLYVDDEDVWTEQLRRRLQAAAPAGITIEVLNTGRSGDSTREHITMLAQRTMPFEPDLVLVMPGINDLTLHMAEDYSPYREDARSRLYRVMPGNVAKLKYLACSASQIARRIVLLDRGVTRVGQRGDIRQDFDGQWMNGMRKNLARKPVGRLEGLEWLPLPEYEDNLRSLIGICQANSLPLVFVTQPSMYRADLDEDERSVLWFAYGERRYDPGDLAVLLARYNETLTRVAAEFDVPVIDAASALPRDTSVFYDDCHFNVNGCTLVAELLATALLDHRDVWLMPDVQVARAEGEPAMTQPAGASP